MQVVFFDDAGRAGLLPLTYTRPACELRTGILTISETWTNKGASIAGYITEPYLSNKYPKAAEGTYIHVNGRLFPDDVVCEAISRLGQNEALIQGETVLAWNGSLQTRAQLPSSCHSINYEGAILIERCSDLFSRNDEFIHSQFKMLTADRISAPLHSSVTIIGDPSLVFAEPGARVLACTLNTESGPIYLGADSEVMEGSNIRGPFALCEHAGIKMGAKVYGATTIGPHCKAGGEIGNSVMLGYSNKGHDGYMGNSVLGEWCNLGADTNTSNLKNNYSIVKTWNYATHRLESSGLTFVGLTMGDHSKCAINTQFNTGTTVGCCANIFGGDFPPKFIPSFSWGGAAGFVTFDLQKAYEVAEHVMMRRKIEFTEVEALILKHIFEYSAQFRE